MAYRVRVRRARQVKQGLDRLQVARGLDAKGGRWVAILNVLKGVVPEVDIVGDQLASHVFPEDAGITHIRDCLVECLTTNRPPSFSDLESRQ